ncbi:hypothetical protein MK516_04435 [Streptococcus gallolyticus subsp. gallolyticus]|uniref:hypothetical protein n=1 Tax=Streptococcus gallolyticus TaxID=315405 RepID=UPI0022848323|nr:hypothetical protein [Streptococcus gallolyticus]MCY7171769.1 hypothetical protein [Streptococcus gallolyticus subsp. gallolyticus]
MIKKYIKTTPVEAIQVKPYNYNEVIDFANEQNIVFGSIGLFHTIRTADGYMGFNDFDYLIKNSTGECYPCRKDIFEETYKEVNE